MSHGYVISHERENEYDIVIKKTRKISWSSVKQKFRNC